MPRPQPIRFPRVALVLLCAVAGSPAARAQSVGLYGNTPTFFVPFDPITDPNATDSRYVKLTLNGPHGPAAFLVDTGSLGIVAGTNYYTPGPGDVSLGTGQIQYTTSGTSPTGTVYLTNVILNGANGQTATARVPVLAAITPGNAQMGIGFDRGGIQLDSGAALPNLNPLLGLTAIGNAPVSSVAPGYTISFDRNGNQGQGSGITVGLSAGAATGFALVQLTPPSGLPAGCTVAGMGCPYNWPSQQAAVKIDGTDAGTLPMLPDSGIGYMLVTAPGVTIPGTITAQCSASGKDVTCLPPGATVQVDLPGSNGVLVGRYSFTVGGASPGTPYGVQIGDGSSAFTNLGRAFFEALDYLYDPINGFVGYRASGVPGTNGAVTPMLALQGNLALPPGFTTTLPSYLLGASVLTQAGSGSFGGPIGGTGSLTLLGGNLALTAANTYTGGTTVDGGVLTVAAGGSIGGLLTVNPGGGFVNAGTVTSPGTWQLNRGSFANAGTFTANLANTGSATNTGTFAGAVINGAAGSFVQNGTVTGTFANFGRLSGTGTFAGALSNAGLVAPGNSIGTLSVTGDYTQSATGIYALEVAASGQSDLLTVGGTATLGGAVGLVAQAGAGYAARTTYRILTAAGGLGGSSFATIVNPYPFLRPTLGYDANNAYLTLQIGGFATAAATPTQAAVGRALDASVDTASGDFAQVLSALATNVQGPAAAQYALQALSGNNYAGFASSLVQGAQSFMNNFAGQAGGGAPSAARVALAEACDVACEETPPARWGAWGGGIGGLGSIGGSAPVGAVTYNAGGFAVGLDRQFTESFRLGITTGYSAGTQWVSGFAGQGKSDTVTVGLYGNYAAGPAYLDALAGYAWSGNQMWRPIVLPGVSTRTAYGQAGVNQWYGQLEGGWRFDLGTAANAWMTPFARLQAYTGTQDAFAETGAQSLNLSVAQQTTNSLRSVLGAQLGGSLDLGWRDRLALQLRLGWSHEYADVSRPVTAALAGAPALPFTTFGISPNRDGALLGFAATTSVAEATSLYVRYEGTVSGPDNAHAFTAGLRMTW